MSKQLPGVLGEGTSMRTIKLEAVFAAELYSIESGIALKMVCEHPGDDGGWTKLLRDSGVRLCSCTHWFYVVGERIFFKDYNYEGQVLIFDVKKGDLIPTPEKEVEIASLPLTDIYKRAIELGEVEGILWRLIHDFIVMPNSWAISVSGMSILEDGTIQGLLSGKTDHDINPPERILYWYEHVDINLWSDSANTVADINFSEVGRYWVAN